MSDPNRKEHSRSPPRRTDQSPPSNSPPRNPGSPPGPMDRPHKISIDSDDEQATHQPVPTQMLANSQFESDDAARTDRSNPVDKLRFDMPSDYFKGPPPNENREISKTPPKVTQSDDLPTLANTQVEDSPTLREETELRTLLENNAMKKNCTDHNQMIVTICTDFSCPKRFWCGICCVKSKDLYVKYSSHMVLISDFLEENIARLYKIKTFTEGDKSTLEDKLENIVKKNEVNYDTVWELIEKDIDKYKRELLARVDLSKNALKDRLNRNSKTMKTFYGDLKTRIKDSKTRDVAQELQGLRDKVEKNQLDSLEMIETIGNKVNVDILEIENLNYSFNKAKSFIDYVYENYDVIRDQTVPTYISMEKWIEPLVDKVEVLSAPKIKTTLEEPFKDLDSLFGYYEKLISRQLSAQDRNTLMNTFVKSHDQKDKEAPRDKNVEEPAPGGKKLVADNRRKITGSSKDEQRIPGGSIGDRPESSQSRSGFTNSRAQLPTTASNGISPTTNSSSLGKIGNYANYSRDLLSNDLLDVTEKGHSMAVPSNQLFDGGLIPQYTDSEVDAIDKVGTIALSQDSKDFQSILYLHNNMYLIASFMKKDNANLPSYGFKISFVSDDGRVENGKLPLVYSSESLFLTQSKICNIAIVERESDNLSILCVNTEDGYIYLFSFETVSEGEEFVIELESTIIPKHYEGVLTSMRRLGSTDYLVCTNTKGEILTFDTIKADLISTEKRR